MLRQSIHQFHVRSHLGNLTHLDQPACPPPAWYRNLNVQCFSRERDGVGELDWVVEGSDKRDHLHGLLASHIQLMGVEACRDIRGTASQERARHAPIDCSRARAHAHNVQSQTVDGHYLYLQGQTNDPRWHRLTCCGHRQEMGSCARRTCGGRSGNRLYKYF